MYDIVILGAGPAGLSAAVAARQKNCSALVISNPPEQNPLFRAHQVDNYLGMPHMNGEDMLNAFRAHAEEMGVEFITGRVISAMAMGNEIYLTVGSELYQGKKLILASGVARGAKYPGEEALLGRGVSYCATCDGMLYRGRRVVVIGRSKDAPQEANYLSSLGCQVTYVSPQPPNELKEDIPFVKAGRLEVIGDQVVTGILADGAEIACDGVFILRETVVPTELFPDLETENGAIKVDRQMHTNLLGIFAAGDCTGLPLQVAKAVGEGLIAAETAADELLEGK